MVFKPPSPPYLGPAAHTSRGSNKPIRRIVIHSTVSPCEPGGARDIAAYFRGQSAGGSAHYVIDPAEVVQVVLDSVIAWHAPPNGNSIGLEMCDIPGPLPGDKPGTAAFKAARRAWRWVKPNQRALLKRTATLTAELCLAYDVPVVFVNATDLRNGREGITTHNNVSKAWGQSTHWDPGFWPQRAFMRLVRAEVNRLKGEAAPAPKPEPKPTPAPKPTPKPEVVSLEVATANVRHALKPDVVRPTIAALTSSTADIIGWQEMGGRRGLLEVEGWGCYMPDEPDLDNEGGNPIMWRESVFDLKRDDVRQATERTRVPAAAKGPSNLPPYHITRVSLVHKVTGRTVHVFNVHLPASLDLKVRDAEGNVTQPMRDLAEQEVRLLVELADLKGQVLITGDFNTGKPLDLADGALRGAGFASNHEALGRIPTHGTSTIDHVLFRGDALTPVAHRTIAGQPSDHVPLLVRFNLAAKES